MVPNQKVYCLQIAIVELQGLINLRIMRATPHIRANLSMLDTKGFGLIPMAAKAATLEYIVALMVAIALKLVAIVLKVVMDKANLSSKAHKQFLQSFYRVKLLHLTITMQTS